MPHLCGVMPHLSGVRCVDYLAQLRCCSSLAVSALLTCCPSLAECTIILHSSSVTCLPIQSPLSSPCMLAAGRVSSTPSPRREALTTRQGQCRWGCRGEGGMRCDVFFLEIHLRPNSVPPSPSPSAALRLGRFGCNIPSRPPHTAHCAHAV